MKTAAAKTKSTPPRAAHQRLELKDLSGDQREAHDGVMTWLNRATNVKPTLTLAGYAGTGKTAVLSVLAHELTQLGPIAFATFTGKASSVLGRKLAVAGIPTVSRVVSSKGSDGALRFTSKPYCGTIHGLVYRPCDVCMVVEDDEEHTLGPGCSEADSEDDKLAVSTACKACHPPAPVKAAESSGPCLRCQNARYLRRERLDRRYAVIVIDEASMVSDDLLQVLLSYNTPILAVGDHGQLPPVKGAGSLMRAPDLRLERIHRQAEGNPIIALSARVRATGDIADDLEDGKHFTLLSRRNLEEWVASRWTEERLYGDSLTPEGPLGSTLVAWTNRTRCNLNELVRGTLGLDKNPKNGEVVICLKNDAPIYNGMRGIVVGDTTFAGDGGNGNAPKWKATIDFPEDGQTLKDVLLSEHQFFAEKTLEYEQIKALGVSMAALGKLYDFGYALTCHKMQGSQCAEVGVVIEPGLVRMSREDRTRWIYTGVTRAADRLTVIR